jgi:gas vesicle protein
MLKSENKVGSIELLEQKLKSLEAPANKTSYWQKLSDKCSKMSADQLNFVISNDKVINAKSRMMEAFNLFLFEKFKDDFIQYDDFKKLSDEYIDTIEDIAKDYSEKVSKTIAENEEQKAEIEKLKQEIKRLKKGSYED